MVSFTVMELDYTAIHLLSLALVAIVIIIADYDGYRYLRGHVATLPMSRIVWLHRLTWIGLLAMILSGMGLIGEKPSVVTEPAFIVKMLMVLALVINGVAIGTLSRLASTTPFAMLAARERHRLYLSGFVSVFCWLGAAFIGFVL